MTLKNSDPGRDFARSWEQRSWAYASDAYVRMKKMAALTKNAKVLAYATNRMLELEEKYPSLKKD